MKSINLAKAILRNKNCLGFVWKTIYGKYEVQNDNDLGLDLEIINAPLKYTKKVFIGKYYFYVMYGYMSEATTGVTLNMAKLLLKECHSALFNLTAQEQKRLEKYYG